MFLLIRKHNANYIRLKKNVGKKFHLHIFTDIDLNEAYKYWIKKNSLPRLLLSEVEGF
jgi:pyruvate formate-lyase activating enzyme-like uncharacterized protein